MVRVCSVNIFVFERVWTKQWLLPLDSIVCRSDGKAVKEGYKCMHCTAVNSLAEIEGFAETQPNNLCTPCYGINNLREALDAEIKRNGVRL